MSILKLLNKTLCIQAAEQFQAMAGRWYWTNNQEKSRQHFTLFWCTADHNKKLRLTKKDLKHGVNCPPNFTFF